MYKETASATQPPGFRCGYNGTPPHFASASNDNIVLMHDVFTQLMELASTYRQGPVRFDPLKANVARVNERCSPY